MIDGDSELTACKQYEARLEELLNGVESSSATEELTAHLDHCAACREALEAARLGRSLLHANLEPAPEPSDAFARHVLTSIRAEEARRQQFWRPLEVLASRLALAAATALLVLSVYLFEFAPPRSRELMSVNESQVSDGFPEPASQPADKDEVLLTLAGNSHGR